MRITTLTLLSTERISTGAVELTFAPARPLPHRAGHGGLLHVPGAPGAGLRPFTLSSDAHDTTLSIATTLHSASGYKQALAALQPGDRVRFAGAFGTLPALAPEQSQVLIAQGIGITPFLSMARTHAHLNATLLQVGTPHFFHQTASAAAAAEHHSHREGLFDGVRRALQQRPGAHWSVSGRADFVSAVTAQLRRAGVPSRRIHKDTFWTLHPTAPEAPAAPTSPVTERAVTGAVG